MHAVLLAALLSTQTPSAGADLMAAAKGRLASDREGARSLYQQAAAACEAARDFRCAGLAYNELGLMAFFDGQGGDVARWYGQAVVAFERAGLRAEQAMAIRATTFDNRMSAGDRLTALDRAEAIAATVEDSVVRGVIRHAQGDQLFVLGRFAESQAALQDALALLEAGNNQGAIARVLTSLGRGLRLHGRPDLALAQYQRALNIQQASGDLAGQAQTLNAISISFMALNNRAEAVRASERAYELAKQSKVTMAILSRGGSLGITYAQAGRLHEARSLLSEVIRQLTTAGQIGDIDVHYLNLADVELRLRHLDEALAAVNAGLEIAERRQQPEFLFHGYETRARIPEDALKQGFSDTNQGVYSTLIRVLARSGRHAEAMLAGERGRARAFLDLLATRSIGSETGGATLLSRLRDPKEPLLRSFVSADPPQREGVIAIAKRLGSHIVTYWVDEAVVTIAVASPLGEFNTVRVDVAAGRLETLIRSTWHTDIAGSPTPATRGGRVQINDRSRGAFRDLYDVLILPIRRWLPERGQARLTIVPHGPLFRLSFAALANERHQYLIEGYSLHYAPSVAVFELTGAHRVAAPPGAPVIVADPDTRLTVAGEPLGALPAARREAVGVAAALRSERPVRLTGAPATERRVRELAPAARILHLATHGIVPDDQPFDGFLALSGEGKDPAGDGKLTAREVYDLRLTADLVVLSGCRTARGEVTGDGVLGLGRAFLYAGTPSLMATLWDVYDDSGAELLPAFYTEWSKRGGKASALREAQIALIRRLRAGAVKVSSPAGEFIVPEHPAFWAGFVLIGEP
jgi:CHAT domain-containing protein/tetratricopeptide (TPR) repeat protein